jgi:hypothetical protein
MAPDWRKPCIAARNLWRSTGLGFGDRFCLGRMLAGDGGGDPSDLLNRCEAEGAGGVGATEPPPSRSLELRQRKKMTCAHEIFHQFIAASASPPVATSAWAACSAVKPALVSSCVSWAWLWSIRSIQTSGSTTNPVSKKSCCRSRVQRCERRDQFHHNQPNCCKLQAAAAQK